MKTFKADGESTRVQRVLSPLVVPFVVFVVVSVLLLTFTHFVFRFYVVPSGSMEPTIITGQRIITNELATPHRGDVVVFEDPGGWVNDDENSPSSFDKLLTRVGLGSSPSFLVKRVIGVPGDKVMCCSVDGNLVINGVEVVDSLTMQHNVGAASKNNFEVVLGKNDFWMMGDNRDFSADSRCQAEESKRFVSADLIKGVVLYNFSLPFDFHKTPSDPNFAAVPVNNDPVDESVVISSEGCS